MHTVDEQFAVLHGAVRIFQIHGACPDGLDFRAAQLDPGLVLVLHEVIVVGLAVLRRDFDSFFLREDHLAFRELLPERICQYSTDPSALQAKQALCIPFFLCYTILDILWAAFLPFKRG